MKVLITNSQSGAGVWCKQGWANAFKALGHTVEFVDFEKPVEHFERFNPDLWVGCTTYKFPLQKYREKHPEMKVALGTLVWTDENIPGVHNPGVQVGRAEVEFAKSIKPNLMFSQFSKHWRHRMLKLWEQEGYKLGSMEMAADSEVYPKGEVLTEYKYDYFYVGGFWYYKSQNIVPWLLPIIREFYSTSKVIGKGWPMLSHSDLPENIIGRTYSESKVAPNLHEPHSHFGYDVVERPFKAAYCGGLVVSDFVTEMKDMGWEHGKNCLFADHSKLYQDTIREVIAKPLDFLEIRKNGIEFVANNHTYIHRVEQLLKDLNGQIL